MASAIGAYGLLPPLGSSMAHAATRRSRHRTNEAPPWRAQIAALRYVPALIQLMWQTHRGYTAAMVVLRLLRAFIPLATLWGGKLIIDSVVAVRETAPDFSQFWSSSIEIAIVLAGEILARVSALVESLLGDLFANYASMRLMAHAATLDLSTSKTPHSMTGWSGHGGRRPTASDCFPSSSPWGRTCSH